MFIFLVPVHVVLVVIANKKAKIRKDSSMMKSIKDSMLVGKGVNMSDYQKKVVVQITHIEIRSEKDGKRHIFVTKICFVQSAFFWGGLVRTVSLSLWTSLVTTGVLGSSA